VTALLQKRKDLFAVSWSSSLDKYMSKTKYHLVLIRSKSGHNQKEYDL